MTFIWIDNKEDICMEKINRQQLIYEINGRKYTFVVDCTDGGVPYGFCKRLGEWGWLYDDHIQFESGKVTLAKRIF